MGSGTITILQTQVSNMLSPLFPWMSLTIRYNFDLTEQRDLSESPYYKETLNPTSILAPYRQQAVFPNWSSSRLRHAVPTQVLDLWLLASVGVGFHAFVSLPVVNAAGPPAPLTTTVVGGPGLPLPRWCGLSYPENQEAMDPHCS